MTRYSGNSHILCRCSLTVHKTVYDRHCKLQKFFRLYLADVYFTQLVLFEVLRQLTCLLQN